MTKTEIPEGIESILREVRNKLEEIYGDRLRGLVLYGSYARDEATVGSDIDLIVLLKDMEDPLTEMEKYSKEIHKIDFEHDTLISAIPIDIDQYRTRKLPLILNARKEGIAI